jgi:hypothetical protein
VAALNGRLRVANREGERGVEVRAEIPLEERTAASENEHDSRAAG